MQLLLISASALIVSWFAIVLGLYFAIKYKEAGKVGKSKFFYVITMIGEIFGEISWWMVIASIALMIVNFIK